MKSLTEIINILNSELKNDRPNNVIMSTPCDRCAQMDNKLRKFEEEISSLKPIIDLFRTECKVIKQVFQDDLIIPQPK